MVWKLFLWSSLRKSYSICLENSDLAKFWSFKAKIWPFLAKIDSFESFSTYNFQTRLWIFLIFGMEVVLMVLFEKIILYMPGKHLIWWNFGYLRPKFCHFFQNWQFWEFFTYNFQTPLWIFLSFGMEAVLMVYEKIIRFVPGKFWYGKILAI